MLLQFKNLVIRNATVKDADLLSSWWNDGKIMAHAGFPNGTGETADEIAARIKEDTDEDRRLIIELDKRPIGEMGYGKVGEDTVGIGIKICDFSEHDKGYGKILLSMLIFMKNSALESSRSERIHGETSLESCNHPLITNCTKKIL